MEVVGYEVHDTGLALEALESSFWIVEHTGESFSLFPN